MKVVRLGDVAALNPLWDKSAKLDDPVSFVGMASMSDELGKTVDEESRTVREVRTGYTPFRRDDLLVAKITPCFENGKIGRAAISNRLGAGSTEFHVVRPSEELDPAYALHFLRRPYFRAAGEPRMTGSGGQRRVPAAYVADTKIPLPPVKEQRRIAGILDKADELRTKRRQALAHLDTLTQSIFHSMFGNPGSDWMTTRLDELCDVSSGITKGRKTVAEDLTDYPYLAVSNVQDRSLDMSVVKEIAVSAAEARRYRLRSGDLLLTEGGDPDKLGRGTIWNDELPWCLHQNHVFRVRPRTTNAVPVYLSWYLASPDAKSYFLRMAKQTTGIASINKTQLSAAPISLPPLELQQTFGSRIAAVERLKENHRKQLAELDALFASLQHRAFSSQL